MSPAQTDYVETVLPLERVQAFGLTYSTQLGKFGANGFVQGPPEGTVSTRRDEHDAASAWIAEHMVFGSGLSVSGAQVVKVLADKALLDGIRHVLVMHAGCSAEPILAPRLPRQRKPSQRVGTMFLGVGLKSTEGSPR